MGNDPPKDVPSLDELGADDDLPAYWEESTTITVDRWVKESLDRHRDGRSWNAYLEQLRREHADPITLNDVEEIAEHLKNEISMANEPGVEVDVGRILGRIDDLESALPRKVAEEMEGRMR